ncbi:MAG TPA: amidohydrolase family protein, partial [Acidimicrobiales bacterium]|nr:amidohydrolase family protein [Acidimicrobiales bacterium]
MSDPATRYVADAVVACDDQGAVHQPGVVDVAGPSISWVGSATAAPAHDGPVRRLDGLLLPGFVNAHAHAPMTVFRGAAEGVTLDAFLHDVLWPRERRLTAEDVYWGTTLACAEMQRTGVTTSCEMYFHEEAMLAAFVDAGSRAVLTPGVFEVPGWDLFSSWEKRLSEVTAFMDAQAGAHPLVEVGIAGHSAYALTLEGLDAVAAAAQERNALLHLHLAESQHETRELERAAGRTVTSLLAERGFFDGRVVAAHGVWLSDEDLALLAAHDAAIAHCPQSNAKLAVGTARLDAMRRAGIRVGLG